MKTVKRRMWTDRERETVRHMYADFSADEIAAVLGRTASQVHAAASKLGLRKSTEWIAARARENNRHTSQRAIGHRFQAGLTPWNKGRKYQAGGRSPETRFKPGRKPTDAHNYRPIGSVRVNHGYLERKVTDDQTLRPALRWEHEHRLVWVAHFGPIPDGYIVAFKAGCFSTAEADITIDKLELVSRETIMRRNGLYQYPPEVVDLCRLRGALKRRLGTIERKRNTQP